jgi:hypothetical protein
MKHPNKTSTYFIIVALTTLISCGQNQDGKKSKTSTDTFTTETALKDSVVKKGNVTTTISTDINKLGKILDFKIYKPTKVKFKYTYIDNSGQNERLSVPGPSEYYLQAILYFDSLTFEKYLDYDRHADYPSPNFNKDEFQFDWLDKEILTELNDSSENYRGHPDFFFGTTNGKYWYLDKKILISKWSN